MYRRCAWRRCGGRSPCTEKMTAFVAVELKRGHDDGVMEATLMVILHEKPSVHACDLMGGYRST